MLLAADGVVLANSHQRLLARRNAGVALARLGVGLELYAEVVVELEEVGKSLWGVRIACSVSASSLRPLRIPVACGTRRPCACVGTGASKEQAEGVGAYRRRA